MPQTEKPNQGLKKGSVLFLFIYPHLPSTTVNSRVFWGVKEVKEAGAWVDRRVKRHGGAKMGSRKAVIPHVTAVRGSDPVWGLNSCCFRGGDRKSSLGNRRWWLECKFLKLQDFNWIWICLTFQKGQCLRKGETRTCNSTTPRCFCPRTSPCLLEVVPFFPNTGIKNSSPCKTSFQTTMFLLTLVIKQSYSGVSCRLIPSYPLGGGENEGIAPTLVPEPQN